MSDFKWRHYQSSVILGCVRWHYKARIARSWRVDETYVKVKGKWVYLYCAADNYGHTIDFYLSPTRNTKAAKRF